MTVDLGSAIGPYRILGHLGVGGMGEVYRAWDPKLGREVAIKVIPETLAGDPVRLERFERESRTLAALSHPNIVQVFDAGEQAGQPYLVMELVEGETLRERLARGPLPWRQAAELAADTSEGLSAAHLKGFVHRDLKPENLMVSVHGHVKILDFGLASLRVETTVPVPTDCSGGVTEAGTVMGTADYMSPEQLEGRDVGAGSDVFSLGIILFEMITGTHPFRRDTPTGTHAAILGGWPAAATGGAGLIPPALGSILRVCLAREPALRFPSARDLALALRYTAWRAAEERPVWNLPTRVLKRLPTSVVGVSLVLLAAGGGLLSWQRRGLPPRPPAAAVAPGRPSVLALPTRVLGAGSEAYLTDAVPTTLSTLLAGVEGIDTKAPPSSVEVDKWQGDLAQITEAYRTDHLVVTTISKQGRLLVLNVQLVDTRTWKVRWGHQYEGPPSAYNTFVRQAAEAVARTLTREEGGSRMAAASRTSSEVELAMGEGRHFLYRYRASYRDEDFDVAKGAFERALQLDGRHAEAAAELASLHGWHSFEHGDSQTGRDARRLAESWARRALELDPACGLAWSSLAIAAVHGRREDTELAAGYAVKGVCLAPGKAQVHIAMGSVLSGPGSVGLFIAGGRRSMELDPLDLWGPGFVALGLAWMGRAEEGLPLVQRALLRDPGHVFLNRVVRVYALIRLGRLEEAERILAQSPRPVPPEVRFWLAASRGQSKEARALAAPLLAEWLGPRMRAIDISNAVIYNAPFLVRAGLRDDAIRLLQRSLDMGSPPPLDWLLADPDLQGLRRDPRFATILKATQDGAAMVVRQLDQGRARGELPEYLAEPLEALRALLPSPGK